MSVAQRLDDTRQAFDRAAAGYDGQAGNNALIQRMRAQLLCTVTDSFPPGAHLLDLGCGTGLDAVSLAARGYRITAIDAAPAMVARTRARAAQAGVRAAVRAEVLDMQRLDTLGAGPFDGIYSDLGPLNCALDLPAVARACAAALRPGGRLVASVIGRCCPWEIAYYLARGKPRRALLRLTPGAVPVPLTGRTVWTRYLTPQQCSAAFAAGFALTRYRALGLFLPPPYLIGLHRRLGAAGRALGRADDRLGGLPLLRDAGDHFLIVLTRRG